MTGRRANRQPPNDIKILAAQSRIHIRHPTTDRVRKRQQFRATATRERSEGSGCGVPYEFEEGS